MIRGPLLMVLANLAFALSTVFAKMVHQQAAISALEVTLTRFLIGSAAFGAYILARRLPLRPVRADLVTLRALTNLASMICFFLGVQYSTVTKANLLNMTYPVFVFLLAPLINRERSRLSHFAFLGITMAGIYLVVFPASRNGGPGFGDFNPADLLSLLSGVLAGLSVPILRESRKYDASYLILFYLMIIGLVINGAIVAPRLVLPPSRVLAPLLLSGAAGILGQLFTTISFRYLDARTGSLLSAIRILFAALLGALLFADAITPRIVLGGLLILASLIASSGLLNRQPARRQPRP